MNLDDLREIRLRGETHLPNYIFLSLCGSLQDDYGDLWIKPEGDFRALYNLRVVVVYLTNQQDSAIDIMREVRDNQPLFDRVYWWNLSTGFTGVVSPSAKLPYDIFADGRQAQVREELA